MTKHDLTEQELDTGDDRIIGVALKWSLIVMFALAILAVGLYFVLKKEAPAEVLIDRDPIIAPDVLVQEQANRPEVQFTDITQAAGVDFIHTSGAQGEKLLPETMGGGLAFFDADNDGDEDLLLVNGKAWAHNTPPKTKSPLGFFRNDGSGHFQSASEEAGLGEEIYGMGSAIGDIDNDGDRDVFITALGQNRLYRNDGGKFTNITSTAGVAGKDAEWSSSAGFFDADNDGDLDLFVCNYIQWSRETDLELAFSINGRDRAYGPPKLYQGTFNYLYRNNGNGQFEDVSSEAGIQVVNPATGKPMGKGLAVTFVDIDRDGNLDIFVANDTVQNFLFRNNGDGTFKDFGATSGVAFDGMGSATGAMGIDFADYRNNGSLGIGIGNFANENTSFYVQQARDPWQFAEMSNAEGIGSPSRLKLSFGLVFFDYDLDGFQDMVQANGHLENEINEVQPSQEYRQPAQLFWNRGANANPSFAEVPGETVGDLAKPIVGRGAGVADIDGDGDLDVLLTQTGGAPMLLRNDQALSNHWLRVKLEGTTVNRDAIGAWVEIEADGTTQRQQVMPTRSYLSQMPLGLTFGLGKAEKVDRLVVHWPNGQTQNAAVSGVDQVVRITQETP